MTTLHKMVNGETVPLTEAEAAEILANEAAWEAGKTDRQWAVVRAERNAKLAASDWTQLPDAPADAAVWAVYRQALRDVMAQNDPFNIVWPVEPAPEGTV